MKHQIGTIEAQLAHRISEEFRAKPESQFIASEFALRHLAAFLQPSGLTIDMHGYFPSGYKVRLARRKKPWLMPLPKLQIKKKGCYLGRVEAV